MIPAAMGAKLDDSGSARRFSIENPRRSLRPTPLALLAFTCGTTINIELDLIGEVFLVELLIPAVALLVVLFNGLGHAFQARMFINALIAGAMTFTGYLLSDLSAANEPWQYVRGWGRVGLLLIDTFALMLLAAHGRRNIWWFVLGVGIGGPLALLAEGVALEQWKIGYGEYCALLIAVCSGMLPRMMAVALIAGCGVSSLLLDYRSLGVTCLLAAGLLAYRSQRNESFRASMRNILVVSLCTALAVALANFTLSVTDETYAERRKLSNGGRYIGMVVAWRAISESPLLGYGSWAAEGQFGHLLRNEARQLERELNTSVDVGRSLLPHSQLLQSWVEGGLLGISFFLFYGWGLLVSLYWFVIRRAQDWLSPAAAFLLLYGLWNWAASPFLGFTRIYIAMAMALIAIARWERSEEMRRRRFH